MLTKTQIDQVSTLFIARLRREHEAAEGDTVNGKKVAGAVLVIALGESRISFQLLWGFHHEDCLRRQMTEVLARDCMPIGFVKYETRKLGTGCVVSFDSGLLGDALERFPQAGEVLQEAEDEVRREFERLGSSEFHTEVPFSRPQ
jgi:hypothetical protein